MLRDFVNPAQPSVALADLANVIRPIDENMKYKLRMVINFDMMDSAGTRLGNPLLPDVLADFRFLCFGSGRNLLNTLQEIYSLVSFLKIVQFCVY